MEYLRVSCCEVCHEAAGNGSSTTTSADTKVGEKVKGQLFDRAMKSTNSYRVGLEVSVSYVRGRGVECSSQTISLLYCVLITVLSPSVHQDG